MTIESSLFALLGPLVAGRCYPDTTPDNATFPLIIYQGAGGQALEWLDRTLSESENYRIQVECWAKSRVEANALALQVRQKIIEQGAAFDSAQTLGQFVTDYQKALRLYGSRQDYSIWIKAR